MSVATQTRPELEQTKIILEQMTENELRAVRTYAFNILINRTDADRPVFNQLTEEEFFERVDRGIAEANAGLLLHSDEVDAEIATEFGLAL